MIALEKKFSVCNRGKQPGVAILAVRNGKTIFKKGFGLANIPRGERITAASNFRLASVSKHFTAFAIAMLEEDGTLDVSKPVRHYIPDFPRYARSVKVHHLIHHISGLPGSEYDQIVSVEKSARKITIMDVLRTLQKAKGLLFKPGERYEYSNSGYVMLALLVERVTGRRFSEFMREEVFLPAGMAKTVAMDLPVPEIENRVTGYGNWPLFKEFDYSNCNFYAGDGGIYSSLNDFERWAAALEGNLLVKPETMVKVYSPVRSNKGEDIAYGYGWGIRKHKELSLYRHLGEWVGFKTLIAHLPEKRVWIVVLCNSRSVDVVNIFDVTMDHCAPDLV